MRDYREESYNPEDEPFFKFTCYYELGDFFTHPFLNETIFRFTTKDMLKLTYNDLVIDGSKGGLVTEKERGENGGIFVLVTYNEDSYRYIGVVQPGTYITSPRAFENHSDNNSSDLYFGVFQIYYSHLRN